MGLPSRYSASCYSLPVFTFNTSICWDGLQMYKLAPRDSVCKKDDRMMQPRHGGPRSPKRRKGIGEVTHLGRSASARPRIVELQQAHEKRQQGIPTPLRTASTRFWNLPYLSSTTIDVLQRHCCAERCAHHLGSLSPLLRVGCVHFAHAVKVVRLGKRAEFVGISPSRSCFGHRD